MDLILAGNKYCLTLTGNHESDSGTRTYTRSNSHYEDGEYEQPWAWSQWKGTGKIKNKETNEESYFNFSTLKYNYSTPSDLNSFKEAVLFKEKNRKIFDERLLHDFISNKILQEINKQKQREDHGMLGINIQISPDFLEEEELFTAGILLEVDNQIRLPLS